MMKQKLLILFFILINTNIINADYIENTLEIEHNQTLGRLTIEAGSFRT